MPDVTPENETGTSTIGPMENPAFAEGFLLHAPPIDAYRWLVSRSAENPENSLLRRLLGRQEPLVDLAVALATDDDEFLGELFAGGGAALRVAVLSNRRSKQGFRVGRGWMTDDQYHTLLASGSANELRAFFGNEVTREDLEAALDRHNATKLGMDRWLLVLSHALSGPFIRKGEGDSLQWDRHWVDAWGDSLDAAVRSSAWSLLEALPKTPDAASVLQQHLPKIRFELPDRFRPGNDSDSPAPEPLNPDDGLGADALLAWGKKHEEHEARRIIEWLSTILPAWVPDPERGKTGSAWYGCLREGISKAVVASRPSPRVVEWLGQSDDASVLQGFYASFQPSSAQELDEALQRSGKSYLESAVWNESLYAPRPAEVRCRFYQQVHGRDTDVDGMDDDDWYLLRRQFENTLAELRKKDPRRYDYDEGPTDWTDEDEPENTEDNRRAELHRQVEVARQEQQERARLREQLDEVRRHSSRILVVVLGLLALQIGTLIWG